MLSLQSTGQPCSELEEEEGAGSDNGTNPALSRPSPGACFMPLLHWICAPSLRGGTAIAPFYSEETKTVRGRTLLRLPQVALSGPRASILNHHAPLPLEWRRRGPDLREDGAEFWNDFLACIPTTALSFPCSFTCLLPIWETWGFLLTEHWYSRTQIWRKSSLLTQKGKG